ncbi:MAG: transcription elongation factor GreA [Deltaproteobacteria bacterium]|nr:transcription elongation factor GreA [Deltaproteobacteria bacterium]
MSDKIPMTREGYLKLTDDLARMKRVDRQKATHDVAEARGHGDISENAEYDAAKERQAFVEGRIREVERRLAHAQIIDTDKLPDDRVVFGSRVRLSEINTGDEVAYRLVGEDEADVKAGLISVTSPLGQALIGRELNDTVEVRTPGGLREYEILEIGLNR